MLVDVACPVCQKNGAASVPDYLIDGAPSGVVAIQIFMKSNCQHSFVAYIDRTGGVRGYQLLDYAVEVGEAPGLTHDTGVPQSIRDVHNLLGIAALGHILAALSTEDQVFLVGEEKLANALVDFLRRILPDSVPSDLLHAVNKDGYMALKLDTSKSVAVDLESRAMIGTPFSAKETEWFVKPIAVALELPDPKAAESFLRKQYIEIWNRIHILRFLLERARQRQKENSGSQKATRKKRSTRKE